MVTLGFLTSGLKSFVDGKAVRSQQMMRGRVLAQGVTVVALVGYAALSGFKTEKQRVSAEEQVRCWIYAWAVHGPSRRVRPDDETMKTFFVTFCS